MSTYRNNPGKKPSINEIYKIFEYTKEFQEPWNPKYIKEKRQMKVNKFIRDLEYDLPRDIRWAIEEDIELGTKQLANHYNKPVLVSYRDFSRSELPKEALEKYVDSGSGPFERLDYRRGLPKPFRIDPDNNTKTSGEPSEPSGEPSEPSEPSGEPSEPSGEPSEPSSEPSDNEVFISLIINPSKDHYLHNAEMRKQKKNDYCHACILHASKAITNGAGDKSSRKTKGRQARERNQIYYANKDNI